MTLDNFFFLRRLEVSTYLSTLTRTHTHLPTQMYVDDMRTTYTGTFLELGGTATDTKPSALSHKIKAIEPFSVTIYFFVSF